MTLGNPKAPEVLFNIVVIVDRTGKEILECHHFDDCSDGCGTVLE